MMRFCQSSPPPPTTASAVCRPEDGHDAAQVADGVLRELVVVGARRSCVRGGGHSRASAASYRVLRPPALARTGGADAATRDRPRRSVAVATLMIRACGEGVHLGAGPPMAQAASPRCIIRWSVSSSTGRQRRDGPHVIPGAVDLILIHEPPLDDRRGVSAGAAQKVRSASRAVIGEDAQRRRARARLRDVARIEHQGAGAHVSVPQGGGGALLWPNPLPRRSHGCGAGDIARERWSSSCRGVYPAATPRLRAAAVTKSGIRLIRSDGGCQCARGARVRALQRRPEVR